ncbi:ABC transporter ATP-binding protein [Clostridium tagluense]|uniref:ABC transporter ATP-binding protein n=1 Tax=Clostridium tagluense TaxID=360422 RepID=UPI001CF2D820|nr:ABC transporter ATP-binding protein [Clostridium tagluense]MCB2310818.1 ABC transporter ATP-binding protein [Clostridium tagluense]MCB2315452.1 ABC transporter ATP-binding protein [Clostridium tagluense]MCB2320305.1 ABC transporter ATP-binding protein [Clostridium tagluense]MCB2325411.1 ABC transporter ATP-binding protein [Clostridium tagluense]MCB2330263.1 ABC transporter ATP-binding protein [Clostridium tagluense]
MNEVLKVNDVTKVYGKQTVLDNVNLSLEQGEIMGLVGPNGAGKTTLMKIITGLIKKYDGDVYIKDENIKSKKKYNTKQIGCVIETPGFYPDLTGYENLLFFAEISGLKDKNEINEVVKKLGIESYVNKKAKKYSLGMKQRLGVAQAVLTYPPILILDEPTNGLDPAIVPELRKFIKYIAKEKKTAVLISSHILSEIELMCDKVAFIQEGKIIKIESLKKSEKDTAVIAFVTSKLEELKSFFNDKKLNYKILGEDKLHVALNPNELENLVLSISKENIPIRSVFEVKESLEQKYLKTMGDEKNA